MNGENRPLSEIYRQAAEDWVDKEAAARLLEETKSAVFAQRCAKMGDIPVNKAEQLVRASPEWYQYLLDVINAKTEANKAKVQVDYIKIKVGERISEEANNRQEMKMVI